MGNLSLKATLELIDRVTRPLNAIDKATKQASTGFKANYKAVKDLERVVGDVHSFKALESELTQTEAKLKAVAATEKQLADAIKGTQNPTKIQIRDLDRAAQATEKLKAVQIQQSNQLGTLKSRLAAAGFETKHMAMAETQLDQRVRIANLHLEEQRRNLQRVQVQQERLTAAQKQYARSQELQGKIRGVGASAAVGAGVGVAAMSVPVKAFADAEDARTQLKVSLMGAGGVISGDYEKINQLATRLGDRLPGTTADFQNMMTMLVRQGIPAQNILGGVGESAAYLAVQLKMAPDAAAEFAAKMQDATRTTSKDMLGLMDLIQRGFYSGVDQNNMLEAFKGLGPVMDMIKRKGLDGSKALAPFVVMLDQAGMRGESGSNAIRKIVAGGFNTGNINDVLKAVNAKNGTSLKMNFTDGKGEFGGIDNMMAQLAKLQSFSTEDRISVLKDMFGTDKEVNEALSTIIGKGQAGYDDVVKKMQAQADLQTRVNLQLGTLKNLWDAASGTFTNAMANFGEAISPELKALTLWIGDVSAGLGAWARENPTTANTIMKIVAAVILMLGVIAGISAVLLTVLGPMALLRLSIMYTVPAFFSAAAGAWALVAPFIPLILFVGLITAAAVLLYKNWDSVGPVFKAVGLAIIDGLLSPLRLAINYTNLFIRGLNHIKGINIPQLPQIPMYGQQGGVGAALRGEVPAVAGAAARPIQAAPVKPLMMKNQQAYGAGSSSMVFNINGVTDPKAVGVEVKRQLDAHARTQDSRARSALKDKD